MTIWLSSIEQLPRALPIWQTIVEDLGNPSPRRLGRALGLSERTVYRYGRTGDAPKVVLLALFWLTRWGRSAVNAQAENDALAACGMVDSLRARVETLERELGRVLQLGRFGCANDPSVMRAYFPEEWPPLRPASFLQDGLEGEPEGGSEAPRVWGATPSRLQPHEGAEGGGGAGAAGADVAPSPRAVTRGESQTGGKVIPSAERIPHGVHGKTAPRGRGEREGIRAERRPVAERPAVGGAEGLPRRPTHAEVRRALAGSKLVTTAAGARVVWHASDATAADPGKASAAPCPTAGQPQEAALRDVWQAGGQVPGASGERGGQE